MKSQIIKSLMVAILLLLATRSLHAWQSSGSDAAGTAPAVDPTVAPNDSALNKSSTTQPVPTEDRDSAFVWNVAFRAFRNHGNERDKLQLSEQQASDFGILCRDYSHSTMELLERRRVPDDGISDAEETRRMVKEENYARARTAKFRVDFMAILTETQRDDVYQQTLKNGGAFALLHPELRTRFQMTDEQAKKISEIRDTNWENLSPHFMTVTDAHYRTKAEPYIAYAWVQLTEDQKRQIEHFIATDFKSHIAVTDPLADPVDATSALTGGISKQVPVGRVVQGGSIMITWSANHDELRGFSNTLGEWEILKIAKQDSIIPIVSDAVSAVRVGDSIAAFSGVKGWWDVIDLSKDSAAQPTVSGDLVQIEDNGHLYTFATSKGRWTSPTDKELQSASSELRLQSGLKLQQQAQRLDEWLSSLPRYKARGIVFNFTRELGGRVSIQTARRSWLKEAEDKLNELAAQPEPKSSSDAAANSAQGPVDATDLDSRIADLREELQSLDAHVNRGADRPFSKDEAQDNREQALRGFVEQAFDLRQQLQRLEAQRMKIKLQLIEANLDAREKNRENIIQHRVNELLDSNGKLTVRGAGDNTTPTLNPEMPATGTPIDLPGPPELPNDGPAGLESHQVRNSDARIQWPQPAAIAKELRLHSAKVVNLLAQLRLLQLRVEQWSKPLEQLQSEGIARTEMTEDEKQSRLDLERLTVDLSKERLAPYQRDWNLAWSSYQSKLRLLRLDLEEAKLAVESLTVEQNRMRQHPDKGAFSISEVQATESRLAVAEINVQRAKEMLKLYADIAFKEPQLNPDSLKSEK